MAVTNKLTQKVRILMKRFVKKELGNGAKVKVVWDKYFNDVCIDISSPKLARIPRPKRDLVYWKMLKNELTLREMKKICQIAPFTPAERKRWLMPI